MLTLTSNQRATNKHETPPVTLRVRENQMDDLRCRQGFGERVHSDSEGASMVHFPGGCNIRKILNASLL